MLTVVDSQLGHDQSRRVGHTVCMRRRVENLDVRVRARHLDLHHRVRLGDSAVASQPVPVGGALSVKGVAVTVDYRHPRVRLYSKMK